MASEIVSQNTYDIDTIRRAIAPKENRAVPKYTEVIAAILLPIANGSPECGYVFNGTQQSRAGFESAVRVFGRRALNNLHISGKHLTFRRDYKIQDGGIHYA